MDEILGQDMRTPINLKNFLLNYRQMLKTPYNIPPSDIDIQDAMGLLNDDERFNTIRDNCSLNFLNNTSDPRVARFLPGSSEIPRKTTGNIDLKVLELKTYDSLTKHKQFKKPTAFCRTRDSFTMLKRPSSEEGLQYNMQHGEEILIYIRFYRPARATHIGRTLERPVFAQEFACLGNNFLSELRDKIYCVCNNKRFFDISETPNVLLPTKDTDPGFFFITDTFYNDNRNSKNMDYSKTIRNWAKKAKGLDNLEFKVASLEETRFFDLTVSLGFPQLYQHHGNCEHVFVFSNIEIVTNPKVQLLPSLSHYPFVLSVSIYNTMTCNICGRMNYVFVVMGSNRQLQDPAYLCKQCFLSFHYIDGKKIGEFSAYRLNDEFRVPEDENTTELYNGCQENSTDEINNEINENSLENSEIFEIFIKEETSCNFEDNI